MFVAPSPKNATATRGSPRIWNASAAPAIAGQAAADDGIRAHVPARDVVEVHRAAVAVRAALDLAVELGHHLVRRRPVCEHVPMRAMRGADHVAVLERTADADRDRLLADAGVQETGELAGAEALLDLLLEAPDQQHLREELDELLTREPVGRVGQNLVPGGLCTMDVHGPAVTPHIGQRPGSRATTAP